MTFRIRFFTPPVPDQDGVPHAGAELVLGEVKLRFVVDLQYWSRAAYERQWHAGVERLVYGAPSTALMSAYRGLGDDPHRLWALWREDDHVYVQELSVPPGELEIPFDPGAPYVHVGDRVPVTEEGLPIAEYRVDLMPLLNSFFFPFFRWR